MTAIDQHLLEKIKQLVHNVGLYQMSKFRTRPPGCGEEKVAREFVSEVDINSEKMLLDGLTQYLPEAGFYGEESGTRGSDTLRWIVDPLDGTTNYLSGLDQFSISIALERSGRIELGVVYRPASRECFSALRGHGFDHDGRRCLPHSPGSLAKAVVGTGFPYRSPDLQAPFFACAQEVLTSCRDIRRFGSAALDLSNVAAGYLQGFWESDLQPYDVAAALLFLEETGCIMTNHKGEPYSPYADRILVCGFPDVHGQLLDIVSHHYHL